MFVVERDVNADPACVRRVLFDVLRWPDWTWTVIHILKLDTGPFSPGRRFRIHQPKLGSAIWEVIHVDDTGFTWVSTRPGLRMEAEHFITPIGTASCITLSLRFSGFLAPIATRMSRGLILRYLCVEADGLKSRAEAESASSRVSLS